MPTKQSASNKSQNAIPAHLLVRDEDWKMLSVNKGGRGWELAALSMGCRPDAWGLLAEGDAKEELARRRSWINTFGTPERGADALPWKPHLRSGAKQKNRVYDLTVFVDFLVARVSAEKVAPMMQKIAAELRSAQAESSKALDADLEIPKAKLPRPRSNTETLVIGLLANCVHEFTQLMRDAHAEANDLKRRLPFKDSNNFEKLEQILATHTHLLTSSGKLIDLQLAKHLVNSKIISDRMDGKQNKSHQLSSENIRSTIGDGLKLFGKGGQVASE